MGGKDGAGGGTGSFLLTTPSPQGRMPIGLDAEKNVRCAAHGPRASLQSLTNKMEVYMLTVLAIHSPSPNHGFGIYSTREAADQAKAAAVAARPDIPECWYSVYKITTDAPLAMGIQSM